CTPEIRLAEPGDGEQIRAVLRAVFAETGAAKLPELERGSYWQWQFEPFGQTSRSVVAEVDRRIVGHLAWVPVPMRCAGRPIRGAWAIDAVVYPEYRGAAAGWVFIRMAMAMEEAMRGDGID